MKIWYARVSTTGQSLDIQIEKLKAYGCDKIFSDKKSGASKQGRDDLLEALNFIREGDELVVTRLDRLARSVLDLANISNELQSKQVGFIVLDQQIDTTTATGKLLFHMLSAIGEFERELINERIKDGINKAKKSGVKFWPKNKLNPEQVVELRKEFLKTSSESRLELARKYWIWKTTMYRLVKLQNLPK